MSREPNTEFTSFEFPTVEESRAPVANGSFLAEPAGDGEPNAAPRDSSVDVESLMTIARAEERAKALAEGRDLGAEEARAVYEPLFARQRDAVTAAVDAFADERRAYFRRAEGEVVRLALAIARKILHRESQVDPMLLAALVRSALDQLDRTSESVLHVHPSQVGAWQRYFSSLPTHDQAPAIVADANLTPQNCRLETNVGSTEINIDSQMSEIERGFFDLLATEPPKPESGAVQ